MTKIGHINDVHSIPPELVDITPCDLCEKYFATMLFEMNPKYAPDLSTCIFCAERLLQLNRMIDWMEN